MPFSGFRIDSGGALPNIGHCQCSGHSATMQPSKLTSACVHSSKDPSSCARHKGRQPIFMTFLDGQRRYYYYEGRPLMDPAVTISRAAQSCGLLGEGILRQHLDVISSVLCNGRRGLRVVKPRVRLHLHCLRIGIPGTNLTVTPRGFECMSRRALVSARARSGAQAIRTGGCVVCSEAGLSSAEACSALYQRL